MWLLKVKLKCSHALIMNCYRAFSILVTCIQNYKCFFYVLANKLCHYNTSILWQVMSQTLYIEINYGFDVFQCIINSSLFMYCMFVHRGVNSNIITWNRVVLLHGNHCKHKITIVIITYSWWCLLPLTLYHHCHNHLT